MSEFYQTSKIERFAKTIFSKKIHLNCWQGSKYASDSINTLKDKVLRLFDSTIQLFNIRPTDNVDIRFSKSV